MKNIYGLKLIATAGLVLATAGAFAQSSTTPGWSMGASLGGSHWKGGDQGGIATDGADTGVKIYGGYSFTPNFALEGGYVDLGKFGGANGSLKSNGIFVDAVGKVPLGDTGFSVLGRLGAYNGKLRSDTLGVIDSERGTNIKVGLGGQYDFNPNMGLRAEWERYRVDALGVKANTDMYSVGLNYKF